MPDWRIGTGLFGASFAAIAWLSLTPPEATAAVALAPLTANLLHLPAYTALGLAAAWMLAPLERSHGGLHRAAVLGLVVAAGILLELLQPLVGRTASAGDVAVDGLGGLLALALWFSVRRRYPERLA